MRRLRAGLLSVALISALLSGLAGLPGGLVKAPIAVAQAQETVTAAPVSEIDYDAWERIAEQAEGTLDAGEATIRQLETLRSGLNVWRTRFLTEKQRDADSIATLESQLDALGSPPENGRPEADDVARRRAELNREYQMRIAPVRRAEEAHALAQSLIGRVDRLIRDRQARQFLERGPTPLAPSNIRLAFRDVVSMLATLTDDFSSSVVEGSQETSFIDNLPSILVMLALAAVLLVFGRRWMQGVVRSLVRDRPGGDRRYVAAMILSMNQFLFPIIGLATLAAALKLTAFFGDRGESLIDAAAAGGTAFVIARWLGVQTFPRDDNWPTGLSLSRRQRVRGRFYASSLGLILGLAVLLIQMIDLFSFGAGTIAVLSLPIIAAAAICVERLGYLIVASGVGSAPSEDTADAEIRERHFVAGMLTFIGRIARLLAILGPLVALAGYTRAGVFFTLSPGLSLGLMALVSFLQRLASGLIGLFSDPEKTRKGLLPVVANFLIVIAALPVFALIWGARVADLAEFWNHIRLGFSIGGTKISPSLLLVLLAVFTLGFLLTRLVQGAMSSTVLPRTSLDPGAQKAMISGLGYIGIALSAMISVSVAGLDLSNVAIVAGALSVGLGFGLQNIVQNFVSGLILLIERPVTEGDWVEVGGIMGTVRRISVRATTIETFDRTDVVVPNSDFVTGQVTNWTRGNLSGRLILPVGVAYGTDTRKVAAILQEIAEAHPLVIVNPPPLIVFQGFGADSLDFEMRVILRDINFGLAARTEINHQIAERFAAEGIEIPFAQRDIWLRNPEALHAGAAPQQAPPAAATTEAARAPVSGPIQPYSAPDLPSEDD